MTEDQKTLMHIGIRQAFSEAMRRIATAFRDVPMSPEEQVEMTGYISGLMVLAAADLLESALPREAVSTWLTEFARVHAAGPRCDPPTDVRID